MHGLINRSIQCFVRDTYGVETWQAVAAQIGVSPHGFEPMLRYEYTLTYRMLDCIAEQLGKPRITVMEDIGTYLVSHENVGAVRRLLRFSGVSFDDFLLSLDDLPDRVRLAVPDLEIPKLRLRDHAAGKYSLTTSWIHPEFGHVVVGVLRGMADDYGALVFLEHQGGDAGAEVISIELIQSEYTKGRRFKLAQIGG